MNWIQKDKPSVELIKKLSEDIQKESKNPEDALLSILIQRGFSTIDEIRNYFLPKTSKLHDSFLMLGMEQAVKRILKAFDNKEKILVYGDYDVDGTTSVTLLHLFFNFFELEHEFYIPDRYSEGYGLSEQGVQYAINNQFSMVICLDCGTKSIEHSRTLAKHKIDFIICDHHLPGEVLPISVALLNPKQINCPYPFKELSGCGIGFKLIQALTPSLNVKYQKEFDPMSLIDLVVLSIACDLVPLVGENRNLAFHGIKKLNDNPLPGIKAIMNLRKESKNKVSQWRISDLVFFIGPRINAAGRLYHAKKAVEVLSAGNLNLLTDWASNLDTTNQERRTIEDEIANEAEELYVSSNGENKSAIVLYNKEWKKGVIGIVASRMVEKFYKPTILLTLSDDKWVGSGRSVHEFDLHEAISACSEFVAQFGGHKYAAGLSIEPANMEAFEQSFQQFCDKNIQENQKIPILEIDEELPFSKVNDRLLTTLDRMEPFGPDNLRPKFLAKKVRLENFEWIKDRDKIVKMTFSEICNESQNNNQLWSTISFSLYKDQNDLVMGRFYDVVYVPDFNYFNGKTYIQFEIKDLKIHPLNEH